MKEHLRKAARDAIGFMPENEGLALYEAGLSVAARREPFVEIGSYCGKSTIYLAAAARERDNLVFTIDHHRGSEEHQVGEEYHDERLVDEAGRFDSFPTFRATIEGAGLVDAVIPVVASSEQVARRWSGPVSFVFIDGGHSRVAAWTDLRSWAPHVEVGGLLAIHDVFPDPADGGRPPFEIYAAALGSGEFKEIGAEGSLRVLERIDEPVDAFWEGLAPEET